MTLYRRGSIWWYDFSVGADRYRASTGQTKENLARRVEALEMQRAEEGSNPLRRKAPTLRDFQGRFFEWAQNKKPKTLSYYKNGWRMVDKTDLAAMRLDRIGNDDLRGALYGSAGNQNCVIGTVSRMLSKAKEWKLIPYTPDLSRVPQVGRDYVITPEQEQLLIKFASPTVRDVLILMLETGMRPSEVLAVQWEHVDWSSNTLFIPSGKTAASRRRVAITTRAAEVLYRRMGKSKVWAFPSSRNSQGHVVTVAKEFDRTRKRADLPANLVLYAARHTFGTRLFARTKDLKLVMQVMGHTSVKAAMVYQHPDFEQVRTAMSQFAAQ